MRFPSLHLKSSFLLYFALLLLPLLGVRSVANGQIIGRIIRGGGSGSRPIAFLDGGKTLAGLQLSRDINVVTLWDVKTGKVKHVLDVPVMQAFAFSHSGKTLAMGSGAQFTGEVQLRDVATGKLKKSMPKERYDSGEKVVIGPVFSLAFSNDDSTLSVGVIREGEYSIAGEVLLLDTSTGKRRHTTKIESETFDSLALCPAGQIVAAIDGAEIKLCSMKTGKVQRSLIKNKKHSPNYVDGACFSPNGQTFYTSTRDRTIKVWNIKTGVVTKALAKVAEPYRPFDPGLAVSPDGKMLAIGGKMGIHLIDIR
ncbi:hypothetical protein EON83_08655 [bacterium]|nr:MAG: hypothetical protein EON83_08655 [bacterium]